ncbi:MAG: hypothetical protein N2C12_12885, partial [Planctomycetales bacterium]
MATTSSDALVCSTDSGQAYLFQQLNLSEQFWTYFSIIQKSKHAFLLDSALSSPKLGKHSFMGCDPV